MMIPLLDPVDGVVTTPAMASEELVIPELWISFVSLLRSHLGAMQVSGKLSQASLFAADCNLD